LKGDLPSPGREELVEEAVADELELLDLESEPIQTVTYMISAMSHTVTMDCKITWIKFWCN